ncbi:MAG TPA: DoxX family protein [Rhizomicrobium sp.]|jgi:putative oxidoreductase|nr:DoxX family protein [Rhizomicrobium sp.]
MSFSELISPLLGRLALAWFFLSEAYTRATQWDANVSLMAMLNLPVAPLLLAIALIVMILGGLALLFGYHTRHGAMLLFGFVVVATFLMHDYWHLNNAAERASDYEVFARNIAIAGGLLMVIGLGGGPFAFDNAGKQKKR